MTDGGKGGNPKAGFPPFPPSLEIACAIPTFPHALRLLIYNHWGTQTGLLNLSPMSVDRSVTYVPGRTFEARGHRIVNAARRGHALHRLLIYNIFNPGGDP